MGLDLKDWRKVTQDEAIEAIVHFYLNLINQWDMSAASIEAAMTHLKQLVRQFATGTLSQDEFLDLLSEEDDDDEYIRIVFKEKDSESSAKSGSLK